MAGTKAPTRERAGVTAIQIEDQEFPKKCGHTPYRRVIPLDERVAKVRVAVDAYPNDRFVGKVTRIGSATTARFALIPTPNPSGNFTKITQRVPVKINMVEMPKPLSPGMMVEVEIDAR